MENIKHLAWNIVSTQNVKQLLFTLLFMQTTFLEHLRCSRCFAKGLEIKCFQDNENKKGNISKIVDSKGHVINTLYLNPLKKTHTEVFSFQRDKFIPNYFFKPIDPESTPTP